MEYVVQVHWGQVGSGAARITWERLDGGCECMERKLELRRRFVRSCGNVVSWKLPGVCESDPHQDC